MLKMLFFALAILCLAHASTLAQPQPQPLPTYPKTVGYLSFILPLVTINKNTTTNDFSGGVNQFAIGFPVGVNVLYREHFGFSYEIIPTIQASPGMTKTSKILFDPGPMFRFSHGFTFVPRLAFETTGRYGFTPVFNEVYARTKVANYFVAMSLPARFGNNELPTIGLNLQLGLIFN
ncbi:MAG TPA: hypothetical protein VKR53_04505 [Puia sp.]|nr:hypothetical protein [Puia sp.]